MSKDEVETELVAASSNERAVTALVGEGGKAKTGKSWNPAFVADTLTNVMIWQAIVAEVSEKHVKVPAITAIDPTIKASIIDAFGGKDKFKTLPVEFQNRQIALSQQVTALIKAETANLGSPEEYFKKNKAKFPAEACAKHILVATEAEAIAATKRIKGGEDFGKVAQELSKDPGSGAKGGDLGCANPAGYVAEFADAVTKQKIGELGAPVKTQFGYHLIVVTKRGEATFASAKAKIESDLEQEGSLTAQKLVFSRLTVKTVSIDPALGSLDTSGQFLKISPPKAKIEPAGAVTAPLAASTPAPETVVPDTQG